jgi:hypothetical protein
MTSTDPRPDPNDEPQPLSDLHIHVRPRPDGIAEIELQWYSDSPWVPDSSMILSTAQPRVLNLGYKGVVEGVIIQLRPILQAMLSEVWPPF